MNPLTPEEITETSIKCPACQESFTAEEWEDDACFGTLSGEIVCENCYYSDLDSPSTLIQFNPAVPHYRAIFGEHNIYHGTLADLEDSDIPAWFGEIMPHPWPGRVWRSTSGWRGHYETDTILELTKIEDGWMTGDYGDVPWKKDSHAFLTALEEGEITPPAPIYVLFEPTSNVFSTATTVMSKPDDAEAVKEWLSGSEYDLHRALG
jgi:hypothetical protein